MERDMETKGTGRAWMHVPCIIRRNARYVLETEEFRHVVDV